MQNIKAISFWAVNSLKKERAYEWNLGLGPCGREVDQLEYEITLAGLTIRQTSYPKGFGEAQAELLAFITESKIRGPLYDAKRETYETLRADKKVERFTHKLEDVVGRIKALE